jgi:hypothetical protein
LARIYGTTVVDVIMRAYSNENGDPLATVGCRTGHRLLRTGRTRLPRIGRAGSARRCSTAGRDATFPYAQGDRLRRRGLDDCAAGSPRDSDRSSRCAGSVLALGSRAGGERAVWFRGVNYPRTSASRPFGSVLGVVYIYWSEKANCVPIFSASPPAPQTSSTWNSLACRDRE